MRTLHVMLMHGGSSTINDMNLIAPTIAMSLVNQRIYIIYIIYINEKATGGKTIQNKTTKKQQLGDVLVH